MTNTNTTDVTTLLSQAEAILAGQPSPWDVFYYAWGVFAQASTGQETPLVVRFTHSAYDSGARLWREGRLRKPNPFVYGRERAVEHIVAALQAGQRVTTRTINDWDEYYALEQRYTLPLPDAVANCSLREGASMVERPIASTGPGPYDWRYADELLVCPECSVRLVPSFSKYFRHP